MLSWKKLLCDDRIRSFRKASAADLRSEFEKDYHRIIGSASFRRLQDKTQVFPLDKSDFVRTRLTHSLEVSSISKSIARNAGRSIIQTIRDPEFLPEYQSDICDILQCAGLLHDIGNPPFGHFGETSIRTFFKENLPRFTYIPEGTDKAVPLSEYLDPQMMADLLHFEGNAQAIRLATKLHYLVDEYGMNLTKALLASIIKYPVSSLEIDPEGPVSAHKMGYFYADREIFEDVERSTGLDGRRHPLAYMLEAGDDIAYLTADIEDAFKKGYIDYEMLLHELETEDAYIPDTEDGTEGSFYTAIVEDLKRRYRTAADGGQRDPASYAVQNWIVSVQSRLIQAAADGFIRHYDEIMQGVFRSDIFDGTGAEPVRKKLGDIARVHVFMSRSIKTIEISAERILDYLLNSFVKAAIYYDTGREMSPVDARLILLISDNYKAAYHIHSKDRPEKEKLYLRLMLVTDYVCGMTDSYAQDLYWKLNGRIE